MLLGAIIISAIIFSTAIISLILALAHRHKGGLIFPHFIVLTSFIFLIAGIGLTILFSAQFSQKYNIKSWPSTTGIILSSEVIGDRAFRPNIEYQYIVDNDTLRGQSFLNQPGFGGRMNRLDAAEKTAKKYKAGTIVTVFYNPAAPYKSTLTPGPTYSHFLRLGAVSVLLFIGTLVLLINLFPKSIQKS